VLCHQPSWREDNKITDCLARIICLTGKHCKDTGVRVVITNRSDGVVQGQIIFIGTVVSVPGNDIEGGVVLRVLEELSSELALDSPCII